MVCVTEQAIFPLQFYVIGTNIILKDIKKCYNVTEKTTLTLGIWGTQNSLQMSPGTNRLLIRNMVHASWMSRFIYGFNFHHYIKEGCCHLYFISFISQNRRLVMLSTTQGYCEYKMNIGKEFRKVSNIQLLDFSNQVH